MASTVYETLKNVEKGRQNCIKNAKLANLEATDNMSIFDLGELFLQKNTPEFINKNNPEQGGGWKRPDDWFDTKSILAEAEEKEELKPAYIILLADTDSKTTFSKTTTNKALQGDGYLTSDGKWYKQEEVEHTWDTTQDKECADGYKTRYVIVYMANTENVTGIDLSQFPCLEVIVGNVTLAENGIKLSTNSNSSFDAKKTNAEIMNFEYTEETVQPKTTISFSNCRNLKNVSLPHVEEIKGNATFYYCSSLTSISLPALTTIGSSASSTFSNCSSLTSISLPALTTISASYTFQYCSSLTSISLPALTTISASSTFQYCYSLTSISLPALTTIGSSASSTFSNCYSLTSISLPALTTISASYTFSNCSSLTSISLPALTTISASSTFQYCYSLVEFEFPSTLLEVNLNKMFDDCIFLKTVKLFNEWEFDGLDLTESDLLRDSILEMLNSLADVTEKEGSHTLTLGEVNLSKITEEEKQVATDKGWTIA